jgi:energy-coupling factor transporter ATP-binding protein EcfA2
MTDTAAAKAQVERFQKTFTALRNAVHELIVGQHDVVDGVLTAVFAGGHVLLEGVPGIGKTMLVKTLGDAMHLQKGRIQFTPDLMPADVLGTMVLEEGQGSGARGALPAGPDPHQPAARRRDQPRDAEDAVRAARGDAGAAGHRRRPDARAAAALRRARDAEPGRTGRHLSAARSAARPLPVQADRRLSARSRTTRRSCSARRGGCRRCRRWRAPTTCCAAQAGARRARARGRAAHRRAAGDGDAAEEPVRDRARQQVRACSAARRAARRRWCSPAR